MTNTCTLIGPRIHHLLMPVLIEAQSVMKLRVTNGIVEKWECEYWTYSTPNFEGFLATFPGALALELWRWGEPGIIFHMSMTWLASGWNKKATCVFFNQLFLLFFFSFSLFLHWHCRSVARIFGKGVTYSLVPNFSLLAVRKSRELEPGIFSYVSMM